eukprot:TRINITY_DN6814_c0_g1_i11.p1 TRINITY_DN6814_c0_g1~~TRINITY_DN6814_c0_g1_i11.p1  ORF type:complete len:527 (+),score=95.21 TRINITY_DN6814_c0_g1_i11:1105-2685(+)
MYIRTSRAVLLQDELHRPISSSPVLLNMLLDGLLKTRDPVTFLQLSQLFIQYMKDRSLTEAILVCVMGREIFLSSIVEKIGLLNPVHVVNFLGQFTHFHKLSTLRPHGTPPDTISWLTNSQQFPQKFIENLTESPEDLVRQNVVSVLCDLTAPPYSGMSTHSGILAWTFAISNPSVPPGIPFMTLGGNFRTEVDDSLGYFSHCPQLFWDAFLGNHMKEPYERLHEACMKSEKRLILALPLQIALLRNLSEKRESNFNALVSVAISHIDDYLSLLLDTSHLIPMAPTMTTTMASTVSTNTPTTPSMTSTLTTPFHLSPSTMISLSLSSTSHLGSSRMLILTFMMNLLEFGSGEVVQVLKDKNFFHICLYLMAQFPRNNQLHHIITEIFVHVLRTYDVNIEFLGHLNLDEVIVEILSNCLLGRSFAKQFCEYLGDGEKNDGEEFSSDEITRLIKFNSVCCYTGHLFYLSAELYRNGKAFKLVKEFLVSRNRWKGLKDFAKKYSESARSQIITKNQRRWKLTSVGDQPF